MLEHGLLDKSAKRASSLPGPITVLGRQVRRYSQGYLLFVRCVDELGHFGSPRTTSGRCSHTILKIEGIMSFILLAVGIQMDKQLTGRYGVNWTGVKVD